LQDQLAEEKQKLKELESRGVGPIDDDELVQQMQDSQEEIATLNEVFSIDAMLMIENQGCRITIATRSQRIPNRERSTSRDGSGT